MSGADPWDPNQYRRFESERSAPFRHLVAMIEPLEFPRVVDLGCGTGELTAELHSALGAGETLGIDNSPAMLEQAAHHTLDGVTFSAGDIAGFPQGVAPSEANRPFDVVFSNAALQWVPDHAQVLARWADCLAPTGQLAVQVPANADHPSHLVADEVAHEERFVHAMGEAPPPDPVRTSVLAPETYAVVLHDLGFDRQQVRLQVYGHQLASSSDVVEWVKGTSLNRFRRAMLPDDFDAYLSAYRDRLLEVIGDHAPYFYPFKRILMWARRS
ncbi:MAG: methyltransferase domain-containing protein [Acidimicrobiales bacterium]